MPITGQFPNESYLDGLRNDQESSIAVVYNEFRRPILQIFADKNMAEQDAIHYFQLAVIEAARMARAREIPASVSFPESLHALAMAHFRASTDAPESPSVGSFERDRTGWIPVPAPEALRETQKKCTVWAILPDLDPECRTALLDESGGSEMEEKRNTCREQVLRALRQENASALSELPDWVLPALRDAAGYSAWLHTQELEQGWRADTPAPAQESNRIWRWAVAVFLVTIVGYSAFQFFVRPKTAAEVYADNFSPPGSLMADLRARYGAEMGNDSVSARPSMCMLLLREADAYYQASDYKSAIDPLLLIVTDSAAICQSDAWYFLGIIQLQLEEPTTAVQCFAKIDDIERYGEDLYWYQALAFVQMAKGNPLLRDRAIRAVEQAIANIHDPKRRARAEAMLTNLSK